MKNYSKCLKYVAMLGIFLSASLSVQGSCSCPRPTIEVVGAVGLESYGAFSVYGLGVTVGPTIIPLDTAVPATTPGLILNADGSITVLNSGDYELIAGVNLGVGLLGQTSIIRTPLVGPSAPLTGGGIMSSVIGIVDLNVGSVATMATLTAGDTIALLTSTIIGVAIPGGAPTPTAYLTIKQLN